MIRGARRIIAGLFCVSGALYAATGCVIVAPGESAVVRRFGRVIDPPWSSGLHWGLPAGLDRITRVRTEEVRRLAVGLPLAPGPGDSPDAGEYMTGDLNILLARATVQYRVSDPVAFALRSAELEPALTRLAESSLTRALGHRPIDDALRAGRAAIALDAEADLRRSVDRLRLGVSVLGVSLTDTTPPTEVAAEFSAAEAARSAREQRLNEAKTYSDTRLPAAEARAQQAVDRARAYAERTTALAKARAGRFTALVDEANRARSLTVRRIYLDAIRELLPRVKRKLVLTPDEPIDLSILGVDP
jgi:membrane protease subunit HflK